VAGEHDANVPSFETLSEEERAILLRVAEVLRKLKFGTLLLVVQDGKVVQIEMAEKIRLR
jgi:hypothetical protein